MRSDKVLKPQLCFLGFEPEALTMLDMTSGTWVYCAACQAKVVTKPFHPRDFLPPLKRKPKMHDRKKFFKASTPQKQLSLASALAKSAGQESLAGPSGHPSVASGNLAVGAAELPGGHSTIV